MRKDSKDGREGATRTAEEKRSRKDAVGHRDPAGVSSEKEEGVVTAP